MDVPRGGWQVRRDRVLDRAQVEAILARCAAWAACAGRDADFARLFRFLLAVPLRLSEAIAIQRADLRLDRAQPFARVRRLKKRRPTISDVPLPPAAVVVLHAARASGPVFPVTKFAAIRAWHRICAEAGVDLPKGCAVHIARHTVATEVLRRTRNLRLVQELLGHENPATTAGYAHVALDEQAEALRDLWGGSGE